MVRFGVILICMALHAAGPSLAQGNAVPSEARAVPAEEGASAEAGRAATLDTDPSGPVLIPDRKVPPHELEPGRNPVCHALTDVHARDLCQHGAADRREPGPSGDRS